MSVSTTITKVVYQTDGQNRVFEIPFPLRQAGDLRLSVVLPSGRTENVTEGFSVADGAATYPAAQLPPLPAGCKVILWRDTPRTQETDFTAVSGLDLGSLEASLDKLQMQVQEVDERLSRTVTVPRGDESAVSAGELVQQVRNAAGTAQESAQAAQESAQEAQDWADDAASSAADAYNQAQKLYSELEEYTAGTAKNNYTGSLTTFKLLRKYKADGKTLKVFVDGAFKRPPFYSEVVDETLETDGEDYGDTVVFAEELTQGSVVVFSWADSLALPGGEVAAEAAQAVLDAQAQAAAAAQSAAEAAASADEAQEELKKFVPQMIGDVVWSQSATGGDNPGRIPGWTGETVLASAWPALATFLSNHPELCKTASEVNSLISKYGECPYYVYDSSAGTIKMPVYKRKDISIVSASPDWASGSNVTADVNNKTWTAQDDGYLWFSDWQYGGGRRSTLTINNKNYGLLNQSNESDNNNGSQNTTVIDIKKGDVVKYTNNYSTPTIFFIPKTYGSSVLQSDYPWIVGANSVDGLVQHNGGFISVRFYTREQYENLGSVPQNELCLIEEEIIE